MRRTVPTQRRRRSTDDEPLLFDLPLAPPERGPARSTARAAAPLQPELFAEAEPLGEDDDERAARAGMPEAAYVEAPAGPVIAGFAARLLAGGADALLHLGVLAGVYLGLIALQVEPRLDHWPALATLLVAFSFLSSVISLAFWGQTAGMAWRGLQSRDRLQRPLTFRQAVLRWAGGVLTFAAAGLPLLPLALGGATLADWISRSLTYQAQITEGSRRLS
jgi:hypothetical protein